jgi:hypothetical protein
MELWDDDQKKLLCRNVPLYGRGQVSFNESGYLLGVPPCVWSDGVDGEEGYLPPPVIRLNGNYSCTAIQNATYGHWGVMALWQMRTAYLRK